MITGGDREKVPAERERVDGEGPARMMLRGGGTGQVEDDVAVA
ncbi:hypothetical protein A2U01_0089229, partial [Trifolium medium]|nr:hypothetical protein [Trifolium medium]